MKKLPILISGIFLFCFTHVAKANSDVLSLPSSHVSASEIEKDIARINEQLQVVRDFINKHARAREAFAASLNTSRDAIAECRVSHLLTPNSRLVSTIFDKYCNTEANKLRDKHNKAAVILKEGEYAVNKAEKMSVELTASLKLLAKFEQAYPNADIVKRTADDVKKGREALDKLLNKDKGE